MTSKGTQAKLLSEHLSVPAISTGDIFRAHVAQATELGQTVQGYLDAGKYVPDAITNKMVRELDDMLAAQGRGGAKLEHVLEITAATDELVRRLTHRALEQGRSDDTEEVIRTRQQVYADQTAPLVQVYAERGLLRRVDGLGDIAGVTSRLVSALARGA